MDRDQWLTRRTFSGADFDPERLARLAAERGERISVVLPALNVADTVGPIVAAVRAELVERTPLVDEILVMDGNSTDATARRAAEAGARVVGDGDVLPHLPTRPGKGEAMWRSLAATRGEIVVWLDADVTTPHPEFVTGLVGPLLTDPAVGYVKAIYARALHGSAEGGGRVTEICARPLLNLFYPELAGFVQPLSGEAAGRRELLASLPFMGGYAVEIGLLIDIWRRHGLEPLAQVDLGARAHTHQTTAALGAMASPITRAVMRRLGEEGRGPIAAAGGGPYLLPTRTAAGWHFDPLQTDPGERRPMAEMLARPARP